MVDTSGLPFVYETLSLNIRLRKNIRRSSCIHEINFFFSETSAVFCCIQTKKLTRYPNGNANKIHPCNNFQEREKKTARNFVLEFKSRPQ